MTALQALALIEARVAMLVRGNPQFLTCDAAEIIAALAIIRTDLEG